MSTLKKLMATATMTTALTGGIIGLGEAATMTTANAATSVSAASGDFTTGWHRHCRWHRHRGWGGGWGGWHRGHHGRHHGRYVNRVKVHLNLAENKVRWTHRRGCLRIRHGHGHGWGNGGGWGGGW